MTELVRRGVRALAVGLVGVCVVSGCTAEPDVPGSARFEVTYRPEPGAEPMTVTVEMPEVDCIRAGDILMFGEDVSPAAQAAHLEEVDADRHAARVGFWKGVISGSTGGDVSSFTILTIILPDGLLYLARAPYDADGDTITLTDHPGSVGDRGMWAEGEVVDPDAHATGELTC